MWVKGFLLKIDQPWAGGQRDGRGTAVVFNAATVDVGL